MYTITGITGKSAVRWPARFWPRAGRSVPLFVTKRARPWAALGWRNCARGDGRRANAGKGVSGASAVFVLPPSQFDPMSGYPEAQVIIDNAVAALKAAMPQKVLCLSTIGADAPHDNLLSQRTMMEKALTALGLTLTILRPAWFIENALWDVSSARDAGVIQPSAIRQDIPHDRHGGFGRVAAELIQEDGRRRPMSNSRGRVGCRRTTSLRHSPVPWASRSGSRPSSAPAGKICFARKAWNPMPRIRMEGVQRELD